MNAICFYMLPVFSALIGGLAVMVACWQLKKHLQIVFKETIDPANPSADQVDLEISGLIKKHLDEVVLVFKTQIPMASMFISQAREEKLKTQALHELTKAIPAIKTVVGGHPQVIRFTDSLWRSVTYSLMSMGAIVGLALGLVEMGFIALFC